MGFIKKLEETIENGINEILHQCNDASASLDTSLAAMEEEVVKAGEKAADAIKSAKTEKESNVTIEESIVVDSQEVVEERPVVSLDKDDDKTKGVLLGKQEEEKEVKVCLDKDNVDNIEKDIVSDVSETQTCKDALGSDSVPKSDLED